MNIAEIFYSIEGEGIAIGKPEVFVRLAGCNLRCAWCDTKYALDDGQLLTLDEITKEIIAYPCKNISITGGEPLLQKKELLEFINWLKKKSFWVQLNTNGTIFDREIFRLIDLLSIDCKCPSSMMKSDLAVLRKVKKTFNKKSQIKFVITNDVDFEYAKKAASELDFGTTIFQPEWENKKFVEEIIEKVKFQSIKARIIIQQHKIIWGNKKAK